MPSRVTHVDGMETQAGVTEMTTMIAAGYIAQDKGGYAIAGAGSTAEAARAMALDNCGPWEDRDGNTVGADDSEFGFDAKFTVMPATAALLAEVEAKGGAIAWSAVDGIACSIAEVAGEEE